MTSRKIQEVFNVLKIGTENERAHFRKLSNLGDQQAYSYNFIDVKIISVPEIEEKDHAKLASTSRRNKNKG